MIRDPFEAIERELRADTGGYDTVVARFDADRLRRTGIPEVIYGEAKTDEEIAVACLAALARAPRVLISRITEERATRMVTLLDRRDLEVSQPYHGSTVVVSAGGALPPAENGFVGILTAGTSDLSAAGETATVAREIGCRVEIAADVGVAGLHRLVRPLRRLISDGVDVIVVAAGMDGALPSVVAGLVAVPVIGLPTSVGYGVAHGGHAALNTMLSSCAPGLTVVNIDNGIGAGASAARIAKAAHQSRS